MANNSLWWPHDSYSNSWDGEENKFYSADSVTSCGSDELKKDNLLSEPTQITGTF